MTISEHIFELLEESGMSQKEFAEATNIGQSTISDWKRKKTNPGADKIMIIAQVLKVTPEELLSGGQVKGDKGRPMNYFVIDRASELGRVVEAYSDMDDKMRARLVGYYEAIKSTKK